LSKVYKILSTEKEVLEFVTTEFKQNSFCPNCDNENALLKESRNHSSTFEKFCPICKSKFKPTKNTPFHDVRFGLVKAYMIYRYYKKTPKREHNILRLSKKFNITYKSTHRFYSAVKNHNIKNNERIEKLKNIDLSKYFDD
jgi:hypothetical protein